MQDNSSPNGLDLEKISAMHTKAEEWFRVCAGVGSEIVAYEDGIIYLDILVTSRLDRSIKEMAHGLAGRWLQEEKFESAAGYVAVIYKTARLLHVWRTHAGINCYCRFPRHKESPVQDMPIAVIEGYYRERV